MCSQVDSAQLMVRCLGCCESWMICMVRGSKKVILGLDRLEAQRTPHVNCTEESP